MTEARYRGQKVVVCSPDYSDAAKFADEWLSPAPGTDGALAMAMGHGRARGGPPRETRMGAGQAARVVTGRRRLAAL